MTSLNGFHSGERLVHTKLNLPPALVHTLYHSIQGEMPHQHYVFHSTCLSFLPVTTLDSSGRPWGSILTGIEVGKGGWIDASYSSMTINASVLPGDPIALNAIADGLIAGIGIQLSTRRRNKFAGKITNVEFPAPGEVDSKTNSKNIRIELLVNQAIGNCPKYITIRELEVFNDAQPTVVYSRPNLEPNTALPEDIISFIHSSDTIFLGSTYSALAADAKLYPSHVGMNHRGGRPGFVRVEGKNVYVPDYSGNRFMTSLGNIESTPLASLTFIDYTTGDILYLTGDAKNFFGAEAKSLMPLQNALTRISVTGYKFVKDVFPFRQKQGYVQEPSPYSPPVRLLSSESKSKEVVFDELERPKALLRKIELHSDSIATFSWEVEEGLKITPGQAVILDLSTLLGERQYRHMNPGKPSEVNDDRIRTWTVSSASSSEVGETTKEFSITIRLKPDGLITGVLFAIAKQMKQARPELLEDSRPISMKVGIVGVSGDFILPNIAQSQEAKKLLWIAGGIGITPFLGMLKSLSRKQESDTTAKWDVILMLSTREPEVFLALLSSSISATPNTSLSLRIHLYSSKEIPTTAGDFNVQGHKGRIGQDSLDSVDLNGREVYVCGPSEFEKDVVALLGRRGVDSASVKREGFIY